MCAACRALGGSKVARVDACAPNRCVVCMACVEQEEAPETMELLKVLPGDVNAELIKMIP